MAQLRQQAPGFARRQARVIVVGPEGQRAFAVYWQQNGLHFAGLPDPNATVLRLYGQEVILFKLGRMPAQVSADKAGMVRFVHDGHALSEISASGELLALLDQLNAWIGDA